MNEDTTEEILDAQAGSTNRATEDIEELMDPASTSPDMKEDTLEETLDAQAGSTNKATGDIEQLMIPMLNGMLSKQETNVNRCI